MPHSARKGPVRTCKKAPYGPCSKCLTFTLDTATLKQLGAVPVDRVSHLPVVRLTVHGDGGARVSEHVVWGGHDARLQQCHLGTGRAADSTPPVAQLFRGHGRDARVFHQVVYCRGVGEWIHALEG